jgi:hypothetical protein
VALAQVAANISTEAIAMARVTALPGPMDV